MKLIDFGLCSEYVTKEGHHIENEKLDVLFGNMAFNSPHSFKFVPRTRRDDIFSILYILIFFYTDKIPLFENIERNVSESQQIK